jgi:hypothetical protein
LSTTLGITTHGTTIPGGIMTHGTTALGLGVGVIHTIPGTLVITGDLIIIAVGAGAGTEDLTTATVADGITTPI